MQPEQIVVESLVKMGCKVYLKPGMGRTHLLMVNYNDLVKPKPTDGLEVWGRNQEVYDRIMQIVTSKHPFAEVQSQSANTVIYQIA